MDINPSYNCLLGRPWIHVAGVVPSTLHHKVKFVVEESLIIVVAEEDMIATTTATTSYLEVKKDATECPFRSFEIATATNAKDEPEAPTSHLSQNTWMILKQTICKGAKVGHGLGRNLQGIKMAVSSAPKHNRHGIEYQPSDRRRNGWMGSQKENGMVKSNLVFPPLDWTFRLWGYINSSLSREDEDIVTPLLTLTINVITEKEEMVKSVCLTVYPCPPSFDLNNCSIVEIHVVHKSSK